MATVKAEFSHQQPGSTDAQFASALAALQYMPKRGLQARMKSWLSLEKLEFGPRGAPDGTVAALFTTFKTLPRHQQEALIEEADPKRKAVKSELKPEVIDVEAPLVMKRTKTEATEAVVAPSITAPVYVPELFPSNAPCWAPAGGNTAATAIDVTQSDDDDGSADGNESVEDEDENEDDGGEDVGAAAGLAPGLMPLGPHPPIRLRLSHCGHGMAVFGQTMKVKGGLKRMGGLFNPQLFTNRCVRARCVCVCCSVWCC